VAWIRPRRLAGGGQIRALVRLVVRPDGGPSHLLQLARHAVDVALRRIDVEDERRGDQLLASLADGLPVLMPGPLVSR
jgi:hypothetical protein